MATKKLKAPTRTGPRNKPVAQRTATRRRVQDKPLTAANQLFVERYKVRLNATQAYLESHPNANASTARKEGSVLLKDPRVAAQIKAWLDDCRKRAEHSAERVLDSLSVHAFTPISAVFDKDGLLISPSDLPHDIAMTVKKVKRTELFDGVGAERKLIGHTVEVEMTDKLAAARALGTYHGLFVEKVELTAGEDMLKLIREARERSLGKAS